MRCDCNLGFRGSSCCSCCWRCDWTFTRERCVECVEEDVVIVTCSHRNAWEQQSKKKLVGMWRDERRMKGTRGETRGERENEKRTEPEMDERLIG